MKRESKQKLSRFAFLFCTAAAVAATALFCIKGPLADADAVKDNLFYLKNGKLWQADVSAEQIEPVEQSDLFRNREYELIYRNGYVYIDGINGNDMISNDGSLLAYPAENEDYAIGSLYCELNGGEPVRLAKKVDSYEITDNNLIMYLKENGSLYVSDGKKKNKIDLGVVDFYVNDEGTQAVWRAYNDACNLDIYYQKDLFDGERVRLVKDAEYMYLSENLNRILFIKKNSVYLIEDFGKPEKLLEDADVIKNVNLDQLTFFYTKAPEEKQMMLDYIEDDSDIETGYRLEDTSMERVKTELRDQEAVLFDELYFYNNGQEILVDDAFRDFKLVWPEEDTDLICYTREKDASVKKVKLSDILHAEDALDHIKDANYLEEEEVVWMNGKSVGLGSISLRRYIRVRRLTGDSSKLYFTYANGQPPPSQENAYTLYCLSLAEKDFGKITKVDEAVESIECLYGTDAYYIKNCSSYLGDLYVNGELVLKGVSVGSVYEIKDKSGIACISDVNKLERHGTLNLIRDGVVTPIADRVTYSDIIDEDNIILLRNYDLNKKWGDLEYYDGESIIPIDENVFGIIQRAIRRNSYPGGIF